MGLKKVKDGSKVYLHVNRCTHVFQIEYDSSRSTGADAVKIQLPFCYGLVHVRFSTGKFYCSLEQTMK